MTEKTWVSRAAEDSIDRKVEAITAAAYTLADTLDREVSQNEMLAAALREVINQCQDGMGHIAAPTLYYIATRLERLEDG